MRLFSDEELSSLNPLSAWDADRLFESGKSIVCGIDEVGRGPLAGPICAAAAVLYPECHSLGIKDSKKFSSRKAREAVYEDLIRHCVYKVVMIDANTIDNIGIQEANRRVMAEAVSKLDVDHSKLLAIIDGRPLWPGDINGVYCAWAEKADVMSLSVAAASIIAKVTRDRLMTSLADTYPEYGFENHVGYGSAEHINAIRLYGAIPGIHRNSFIHLGGKKYDE